MKKASEAHPNQRLKALRLKYNWTQVQVAEKIQTTSLNVSRWERGLLLPSLHFRQKLCELFETQAADLGLLPENEYVLRQQQNLLQLLEIPPMIAPRLWHVPYQRNPFFTGRDEILRLVHELLCEKKAAGRMQSCALSGLAGIGKTQTAIEYAYRYASAYQAIFWIDASSREQIIAGFASVADLLNLPEKHEQNQNCMVVAVQRWLNSHRDWLLIMDNMEDVEMARAFLPTAHDGSILLTTCTHALGAIAQRIDIARMTQEEGICFLLRRTKLVVPETAFSQIRPAHSEMAGIIVEAMDGLPLAIDQAGSYIEETQCSLLDYIHLFQMYPLHLLNERNTGPDHPLSVVKTFNLGFEQLQQRYSMAAELLRFCCFLGPDMIPEELLREHGSLLGPLLQPLAVNPLQFNTVLKELLSSSLIRRHVQMSAFSIHRLIQVVLKEQMDEQTQRTWATRVVKMINQAFPTERTDVRQWALCEQLLPHALLSVAQSNQVEDGAADRLSLLLKLASYLLDRSRFEEAASLYHQALALSDQYFSLDHPDHVLILKVPANPYWRCQSRAMLPPGVTVSGTEEHR